MRIVNYAEAIQAWEKRTGKTPIEFADLVALELGDSPARVIESVRLWRRGKRKPTRSRKDAVDAVLARDGKEG